MTGTNAVEQTNAGTTESTGNLRAFMVGVEDIFAAQDEAQAVLLANTILQAQPPFKLDEVEPVKGVMLDQLWRGHDHRPLTLRERVQALTEPGYLGSIQAVDNNKYDSEIYWMWGSFIFLLALTWILIFPVISYALVFVGLGPFIPPVFVSLSSTPWLFASLAAAVIWTVISFVTGRAYDRSRMYL